MTTTATAPQVLEVYTLLQIAAESFLNDTTRNDNAKPPTGSDPFLLTVDMLTKGNGHSSRMTAAQADKFRQDWKVVSHQANTATGFSGTLFEYIGTGPQPTASKYVMSFRSTEFIEDHVRDNKATNELEIQVTGWALGQLSDMQTWWASVQPKIGNAQVEGAGVRSRL